MKNRTTVATNRVKQRLRGHGRANDRLPYYWPGFTRYIATRPCQVREVLVIADRCPNRAAPRPRHKSSDAVSGRTGPQRPAVAGFSLRLVWGLRRGGRPRLGRFDAPSLSSGRESMKRENRSPAEPIALLPWVGEIKRRMHKDVLPIIGAIKIAKWCDETCWMFLI